MNGCDNMRLYIIGLPGVGKSSIGKMLAKELNYKYIDMDNYIEEKACMFIDEIFKYYGEEYFRALESNVLVEFNNMDNVVISTGGGVIKNINNKKLMDGKVIYLTAPIHIIQERCDNSNIIRPLLEVKTVNDLYLERKEMYEKFQDITVVNVNMKEALANILKALE